MEDASLFMCAWHALHPPTTSTRETARSNETERKDESSGTSLQNSYYKCTLLACTRLQYFVIKQFGKRWGFKQLVHPKRIPKILSSFTRPQKPIKLTFTFQTQPCTHTLAIEQPSAGIYLTLSSRALNTIKHM